MKFIRNPKRLRVRKGVAPLGLNAGKVTWDELRRMPDSHFVCPECNGFWFEVSRLSEGMEIGCTKCGTWRIILMITNPTLDQELLGKIHCGSCPSDQWAIIKNGQYLCIGCKKCPEQSVTKIPELTTASGLVLLQ